MDLQLVLPAESPELPFTELGDLAVAAERLGYGAVWLPDHLLPPSRYAPGSYGGIYDPLVALAAIAVRTRTIRLGTSVLVLPMRSPFAVAKQAATLERISGGRFTLGVGIGWDRAEFAAVGADFADRGARADEAIDLIRHLLGGSGPFHGTHFHYETGVFEPKPGTPVPIVVGGSGERALRRAARSGDGWQPIAPEPAAFAARVTWLRANAVRPVRVSVRTSWLGGGAELAAVVDDVHAYGAAGADSVAVWLGSDDGVRDRMARFIAAAG